MLCSLLAMGRTIIAQTMEMIDFGPYGLDGLSEDQLQKLDNGDIIFIDRLLNSEAQEAVLIESAVLFSNTLDKSWKLIAATENQP